MKILIVLIVLIFINYNLIEASSWSSLLNVKDIRIGQTHIIPVEGKSWIIKNVTYTLKVIPNRDTLVIANFENENENYTINVYGADNQLIGSKYMNLPSQFPPNEDNNFGPKFSSTTQYHSTLIPGEWVKKNIKFQFQLTSNQDIKSNQIKPLVGIERNLLIQTIPVYLFGANDTNTLPFDKVKSIDSGTLSELTQKYPVGSIKVSNHPINKIVWDYLVVRPRNNLTARILRNSDQKSESQEIIIDFVELILKGIRTANGELTSPNIYYAPTLTLNQFGKSSYNFGGWSSIGNGIGLGDSDYRGIFIHEEGHALSLWHASEAYSVTGKFTNSRGNLKNSEPAYDSINNQVLSIYVPPTADSYGKCSISHEVTSDGKYCIKQSVMQGGAGDQSSKYRFSIFADIEMCMIQTFFENALYYIKDSNSYQKYNAHTEEFYDYKPTTQSDGLYGQVDDGAPIERDVEVYTIIFTYSTAGTNQVNQFYPIIKSTGNLIKYFDPSNSTDLINILPLTSNPIHSYCYESGCDYTLKVTFKDNSSKYILISKGKRKWGYPKSNVFKDINNPLSADSLLVGVYNVRADKELSKIELLDTPFGFNGLPSNPTILLSKTFE